MKTEKQKAIEKTYGEYWNQVKDFVDENGFIEYCKLQVLKDILNTLEISENWNGTQWRLKSLQGIENNNGWIKIENDGSNLPEDLEMVWLIDEEFGTDIGFYSSNYKRWYVDSVQQFPTHYQPIQKPKPPIY